MNPKQVSPETWLKTRKETLSKEINEKLADIRELEKELTDCIKALDAICPPPPPQPEEPAPPAPEPEEPLFKDHPATRQRLVECAEVIAHIATSSRLDRKLTIMEIRNKVAVGAHLAAFALEFMAAVPVEVRLVDAIAQHTFEPSKLARSLRKSSPDYDAVVNKIKVVLARVKLPLLTMKRDTARIAAMKAADAGFCS